MINYKEDSEARADIAIIEASLNEIVSQFASLGTVAPIVEVFTATDSQTVFTLTSGTYNTDKDAIVFVGGAIQTSPENFAKTSSSVFTMSEGVAEGTTVVFFGFRIVEYPENNIVAVSTGKTLALTDATTIQKVTAEATITVPPNTDVAFNVGCEIVILSYTASDVTIAAGLGVTIYSADSNLKIDGQYAAATLKKIDTDEWVLIGALKA